MFTANTPKSFHHCVAMFGDAWSLLILAALQDGELRFCGLLRNVENISPAILSNRLKKLESYQLITRTEAPAGELSVMYSLTDAGRDVRPVLKEIGTFAQKYFQQDTD
ncbi:MAG TPA: helix-turn-helix domain-containing protein [Patescibacteria group bacterium]|nr:helix-turn-helix domain-containing protein [Patescibacteria group bacterium]